MVTVFLAGCSTIAFAIPRRTALKLKTTDVIATGNEWIALPTIRASDGALENFNVLSMRDRGLLQVSGDGDSPALRPYVDVSGKAVPFENLKWELIESWIPTATFTSPDARITLTYCAPTGYRAALIKIRVENLSARPLPVKLGMHASWGALSRVTYTPVSLRGERTVAAAPWTTDGQVFAFSAMDTRFAWTVLYPGSSAQTTSAPVSTSPAVDASKNAVIAPGGAAEAYFVLGVGMEEYSAAMSAQVLAQKIDRSGVDAVIDSAAEWCRRHTRSAASPDLELTMNRNLLFTAFYAWGRTLDTEQLVGVTSRSPRYYVSAAYWDRDALLWSFPGLLDIDIAEAKEGLTYALTTQLRNIGTHSRFIDGAVLEDGFELDEVAAPLIAMEEYVHKTNDVDFLKEHRDVLRLLTDRIGQHLDPATGLYSTLQGPDDQYRKQAFLTFDNVEVWRAFLDTAAMDVTLGDKAGEAGMNRLADNLRAAILKYCVAPPPNSSGSIFVSATDGKQPIFGDIAAGSLMRLPTLGFIAEDNPLFVRTYDWLHSDRYEYSYSKEPFGLPGSDRLRFTNSWSVADHLALKRGRDLALRILRGTNWDGGIVSEGIDPSTGNFIPGGGAFATAAGYLGHRICQVFCTDSISSSASVSGKASVGH